MAPPSRRQAADPTADRRSGRDRRRVDRGPPGGRERRVGIEPRGPEVVEIEITPEDWDRVQARFFARRPRL
jgi:hypothetical protein